MRLRGDVLKQIRRKRGLSQTALAEGFVLKRQSA